MIKILIFAICLAQIAYQFPQEDMVEYLDDMDDLNFGMFSGYLDINGTSKQLFYIATLSENNYKKDPVIIWFNGGPGCSSLFGFTQEIGPYIMDEEDITFKKNPFNWNKQATVVYIEMPAKVGFSVCPNKEECETFDDYNVTFETFQAIKNLFKLKFPELLKNDLYIAGESYAGIYIPYLAYHIDDWNMRSNSILHFNLKGIMVGNGVTNYKYDTTPATLEMLYQHHFFGEKIYKNIKTNCTEDEIAFGDYGNPISEQCQAAVIEAYTSIEQMRVNPYNIYGKCYGDNSITNYRNTKLQFFLSDSGEDDKSNAKGFSTASYTPWFYPEYVKNSKRLRANAPCSGGSAIYDYLNKAHIRKMLHVPSNTQIWDFCNDDVFANYQRNMSGSQWIYEKLKDKYRVLIFSGDVDAVVPFLGTMKWIDELDWAIKTNLRPYHVNNQVAGYIEEREGLTFATIRGAGHAAPQFKRAESYHLIFNWLNQTAI